MTEDTLCLKASVSPNLLISKVRAVDHSCRQEHVFVFVKSDHVVNDPELHRSGFLSSQLRIKTSTVSCRWWMWFVRKILNSSAGQREREARPRRVRHSVEEGAEISGENFVTFDL